MLRSREMITFSIGDGTPFAWVVLFVLGLFLDWLACAPRLFPAVVGFLVSG